ncbi:hypothetical protein DAKH74_016910 [Maudiozyma humilis]|uniref:BRCT domain-containing protein n=1 Tax=Maudiozyma humilis TaxID=51915 RepID=A0AAV5RU70_MAUHU|nr:hypothetical protein DAKH74_016910 [Kazachstania humilis]
MSLFQDLNFLVVVTDPSAQEKQASAAVDQLKDNGAGVCSVYSTDTTTTDWPTTVEEVKERFYAEFCKNDKEIHFVVAENTDFPFYRACAFDLLLPVVSSQWVTDSLASNRLAKTARYSPNPLHVLKELEFYISKYTFSENEHFFYTQLITLLGGSSTSVLSTSTDYIVSRSYMDPAVQLVAKSDMDNDVKFVFPLWLLACTKSGIMEPVQPYLLTPGCNKTTQKWDVFHKQPFTHQCTSLEGRAYYIDPEMKLDRNIRRFVADLITHMSGTTVDAQHMNRHTTMITCDMRRIACGRQSANLLWLMDVFRLQEYVVPDTKILYKPFRDRVFDSQVNVLSASYSMYFGFQRQYVALLVEKLGGSITTDFSKKNNVLVCQVPHGRKYNTASTLWKRHCTVVNHLWLEDCYLAGEKLDPNLKRYSDVPPRGGLTNHINQQPFVTSEGGDAETQDVPPRGGLTNHINQQPFVTSEGGDAETQDVPGQTETQDTVPTYPADEMNTDIPKVSTLAGMKLQHENTTSSTEKERVICQSLQVLKSGMDLLSKTQTSLTDVSEASQASQRTADMGVTSMVDSGEHHNRNLRDELLSEGGEEGSHERLPTLLSDKPEKSESTQPTTNGKSTQPTTNGKSTQPTKGDSTQPTPNLTGDNGTTTPRENNTTPAKRESDTPIESLHKKQRASEATTTSEEIATISPTVSQQALLQTLGWDTADPTPLLNELPLYDIRAVQTRCLESLTVADRTLLSTLGIHIYDDIRPSHSLNAIFAPKLLRTSKFLKSLGFTPLQYALKPSFVVEVLKRVRNAKGTSPQNSLHAALYVDPAAYGIPEITAQVRERTALPQRVFERAHLHTINIFGDIPGGTAAIAELLQFHGVGEVHTLRGTFTREDVHKNESESAPSYVVVAERASQVKKLKRVLINQAAPGEPGGAPAGTAESNSGSVLVVEWDWCVQAMQTQRVDYAAPANVKLSTWHPVSS